MSTMRFTTILLLVCISSLSTVRAQEEPGDPGKSLIERPVKKLVEKPDFTKRRLEDRVKDLAVLKALVANEVVKAKEKDENPKVKPGLVQWHPDFETACKASEKSGKPVFLFHLLGKLDQRFT